jgi:membrane protease YdiL (CAAX protease family)
MFALALPALAATLLSGCSLYFAMRERTANWLRRILYIVFTVTAGLMFQHAIPGFHNILVFDQKQFSHDAIAFTMYLNFDKVLVGILLYAFFIRRNDSSGFSRADLNTVVGSVFALIVIFVPLAITIGFVRFDPKLPESSWIWAMNNLFLVCFAEEALFRGFIQTGLRRSIESVVPKAAGSFDLAEWGAVAIAAILFGAAHFKGGSAYVFLATIAGLVYGYAYKKSGKIVVPILVHFLLNAIHFFLFTYPALVR